jgi:hypothetical protein
MRCISTAYLTSKEPKRFTQTLGFNAFHARQSHAKFWAKQMAYSLVSTSGSSNATDASSQSIQFKPSESKVFSLASLWARNYFVSVTSRYDAEQLKNSERFSDITGKEGRIVTAEKLKGNLTLASAQSWSMTEGLLSEEIRRHGINPELINPWEIAADSHELFQKALNAYGDRVTPRRLSVLVGDDFGRVRQKYTANDPRAIGFVSMQFHYTGQTLLGWLSTAERMMMEPYFKVMDDHLYMPLKAAYEAAAQHDYNAPVLQAVRHLLPQSTKIAHAVCLQVSRQHPRYQSYNGLLTSPTVKISSIRDVEMFQVYLCLCALEDSLLSVQRELFPLCVMLYPKLRVSWQLVQDMLTAIGWEMRDRLPPEAVAAFLPYLQALSDMFSSDVFVG